MWRERWEGGETKHGGLKHMPTFVVVPKPLKFIIMDASTWQLCAYKQRIIHLLAQRFKSLKMPFDYSSSMANHMSSGRFSGMKAHDWHVFMQQLLLLCLRGLMQNYTCQAIMCWSQVFQQICKKVVNPNEMPKLNKDVVTTLCMLEMKMPLAFFNVMTHLVLHLVEEFNLCGPISTHWMYCIERMNKVMKGYVRCM
jgi:hypothetical protein